MVLRGLRTLHWSYRPVDKQNDSTHNGLMHQGHGTGHACVELVIPAKAGIHRSHEHPSRDRCRAMAIQLHPRGKTVANSSDGPETASYESHNYATVSNTSSGRVRERPHTSPMTPRSRSDTTEAGPGAPYHCVLFPPVWVLQLTPFYTEKSRRVPRSSYERVRMEHFSENSALEQSTRAAPSTAHAPVSMAYN